MGVIQFEGIRDGLTVAMSPAERRLLERLVADPTVLFMHVAVDQARAHCRYPLQQAALMIRNMPGMEYRMFLDDRRAE